MHNPEKRSHDLDRKDRHIMDDEMYFFFLKSSSCVANKGFYTPDKKKHLQKIVSWKYRSFQKRFYFGWMKFPTLGISSEGMSVPVFVEQNAMNGELYENKCAPLVKKFVKTHHRGKNVIFWLDVAMAHYKYPSRRSWKSENTDSCTCAQSASGTPDPSDWALFGISWNRQCTLYKDGWEAASASILKRQIRSNSSSLILQWSKTSWEGLNTKVWRMWDGGHEVLIRL